jgi:hypothetical protein
VTEVNLRALLLRTIGKADEDTVVRVDACVELAKDDVLGRRRHWSFVEGTATITGTATNAYSFPTNCHHVVAMWNDDLRVKYITPFQFREAYQQLSTGDVEEYTVFADQIVLNANLATGDTLSVWFEKTPTSITVADFPRADVLYWGALHYYDPKGELFDKALPNFERALGQLFMHEDRSTEQAKKVDYPDYIKDTHQYRHDLRDGVV